MAEQLGGLYVAALILALFGIAVFVNALVSHGLRWTGRRVVAAWRSRGYASDDRSPAADPGDRESSAFALGSLAAPPDGGARPDERRAFPEQPPPGLAAR